MSNLSDLLPAGASAKSITATDSGSGIAINTPVILETAGTVTEISDTAASMGTSDDEGTTQRAGNQSGACYHITNNSTILSYPNAANSYYATCTVATLSGTTMTMNTPTVINSTACSFVRCAYDVTENRVVFFYKYNASGGYGKARAASVSGSTFTFGTEENAFSNNGLGGGYGDICNLDDSKVALCWGEVTSLTGSNVEVVSLSGSSLTFGTEQSVSSLTSTPMRMASGKKGELLCQLGSGSVIQYVACTVSGTTVTAGVVTEISGGASQYNDLASGFWNGYTSPESTYIAAYHTPGGAAGVTVGRLITVSGTTLTLNATTSLTADPNNNAPAMGWGASATQAVFFYRPQSASGIGQLTELNYSGTTISEGSTVTVGTKNYSMWGVATDQTAKKVIVMYQDGDNSDAAEVNVFSPSTTNLTTSNFLGIADEAISASASGVIVVQGGTKTSANTTLPEVISFGSEAVYESATTTYQDATFDSNSNKVVIGYTDNGNSNYGTAIVGTVSGTSISYGTPVVFDSGGTAYMATTFDSNENKVVIAWQNSSSEGEAIVGTVSGTAISFGTPVVFETPGGTNYISATFDSDSNKVVIAFQDYGNSQHGTAIVGTVSGTAISFGTAVVFEAAATLHISTTFDSDANKVVISYQDNGNSNYGTGIVGTVSGTAISFGTAVVYEAASTEATGCGFDSNSNKVVIAYRDSPNSDRGTAIVGTVSGTSISYGTAVVFNSHGYTNYSSVTFDSNANKVVIAYQGGASPSGSASVGTVSGTAISFVTAVVFNSAHAPYTTSTFDSNSNKTVIAFQDDGNSSYGTGIVGTLGNDFTIGSNYYVQSDGTFATSAGTPSVKAGLAISTTSLLLSGDS